MLPTGWDVQSTLITTYATAGLSIKPKTHEQSLRSQRNHTEFELNPEEINQRSINSTKSNCYSRNHIEER